MALLTLEESLKYLQDILLLKTNEIPPLSTRDAPGSTKLIFLETVIRAFLEYEPFQCISLMSQNITQRKRPSWDEVKKDMFSRHGGLCYSLNSFMFALLTSLGYDVSMTHCNVTAGIAGLNNHVMLLVHDLLTSGDLYLVDVGVGFYIPRAVPLDFHTKSPEYTDSFQTYRFVREAENRIAMFRKVTFTPSKTEKNGKQHSEVSSTDMEKAGSSSGLKKTSCQDSEHMDSNETFPPAATKAFPRANLSDKSCGDDITDGKEHQMQDDDRENQKMASFQWQEFFVFNPLEEFKNLEEFFPCFDLYYSDITKLSMHSSPRAMCWPGGCYLGLVNSKLVQETENGEVIKTPIPRCNVLFNTSATVTVGSGDKHNNTRSAQEGSSLLVADNSYGILSAELPNLKEQECQEGSDSESQEKLKPEYGGKKDSHSQLDMEPLVDAYQQYFPQFSPALVRAALENWKLTGSLAELPAHLA